MTSHGISRSEYTAQSRDEHLRARELKKITEYNELDDRVQKRRSANDLTPEALHLTTQLLKLNPEFYTIWNYRRQILQHTLFAPFTPPTPSVSPPNSDPTPDTDQEDPAAVTASLQSSHNTLLTLHLKEELQLLLTLLSSHPKCYWIWNHRLWTLQQSTLLLPPSLSSKFWQEELGLVGLMLRRDVRNFHGWMYRRIAVDNIENPKHPGQQDRAAKTDGEVKKISLVEQEFAYTTKMLQNLGGMSNYSAWHNRSKLIPRLLAERAYTEQERLNFLEDELELLHRNIATNPHDSSLWFYHRWLIYSNTTSAASSADAIAPFMSTRVKVLMLGDEVEGLKELVEGGVEGRGILKALVEYVGLLHRLRKEVGDDEEEEEEEEEVDEGNEMEEMKGWLEKLMVIDPMRVGRYRDLGRLELRIDGA